LAAGFRSIAEAAGVPDAGTAVPQPHTDNTAIRPAINMRTAGACRPAIDEAALIMASVGCEGAAVPDTVQTGQNRRMVARPVKLTRA
jgi:hypothetical protein